MCGESGPGYDGVTMAGQTMLEWCEPVTGRLTDVWTLGPAGR